MKDLKNKTIDELFRPLTKEEIEKLKVPMKQIAKDFKAIIDHYNKRSN